MPYNLFYIIPIYSNTNNFDSEKIIKIGNITFATIYFPSLDLQKLNNPGDDNSIVYNLEFNKIQQILISSYDLQIIKLHQTE